MATDDVRDQQVATTFVALADTLVADFDVVDFLGLLAERTVQLLDVDAAGVILADRRGGMRPAAGSSEHAALVAVFAAQTQEGPCFDAARTGTVVASVDLAADSARWPRFTQVAAEAGFQAVCALPMRLRDDVIGALTLLNTRPVAVEAASVVLGQALADIATIGILQQRAIQRPDLVSEQLQATLHQRTVIEQAKGVLAESAGLDMHRAYTALRDYARRHQRRLFDVARDTAREVLDVRTLLADTDQPVRPEETPR